MKKSRDTAAWVMQQNVRRIPIEACGGNFSYTWGDTVRKGRKGENDGGK